MKALLASHAVRPCRAALIVVLLNVGCAAPGALQITPSEMTLGRGQAGILRAVDADGVTPPDLVWKSENPAVAEIVTAGDEVQIRARAPGRSCISARVLWEVATTCVTVLDTAFVPAGHLRWAVTKSAVLQSAQIADVIPARPAHTPPSVAMFVVEIDEGYYPRNLTANRRGALLLSWFERDPGLSHAFVTRTRVLEWELDVMIGAIDGQGEGYGATAEGNIVRVDVTTGRQIGATIHVGPGTRVLSGLPDGGVAVRDGAGHVRHYDMDGTLLKRRQTPSDGQHPWRLAMIGNDFIETDGTRILGFHVED